MLTSDEVMEWVDTVEGNSDGSKEFDRAVKVLEQLSRHLRFKEDNEEE